MTSRRQPRLVLQAAALCTALAGALGAAVAQPRAAVHITYSENMYATIAVVAIERGYLAGQGLDVKHASEGSGVEVLEALVGGSTDFGVAPPSRLMAIAERKLPVRAIALNSHGFTSSVVVPAKDQTSKIMGDLKGKVVGVQPATGTYAVWVRYAEVAEGVTHIDGERMKPSQTTPTHRIRLPGALTRLFTCVLRSPPST